jgi:hypothetical protein
MAVLCPSPKPSRRYAFLRVRMSDPSVGYKMLKAKGARHAHVTIRASGRVPGQEARAALAAKRAREKAAGQAWRYANTLESL